MSRSLRLQPSHRQFAPSATAADNSNNRHRFSSLSLRRNCLSLDQLQLSTTTIFLTLRPRLRAGQSIIDSTDPSTNQQDLSHSLPYHKGRGSNLKKRYALPTPRSAPRTKGLPYSFLRASIHALYIVHTPTLILLNIEASLNAAGGRLRMSESPPAALLMCIPPIKSISNNK